MKKILLLIFIGGVTAPIYSMDIKQIARDPKLKILDDTIFDALKSQRRLVQRGDEHFSNLLSDQINIIEKLTEELYVQYKKQIPYLLAQSISDAKHAIKMIDEAKQDLKDKEMDETTFNRTIRINIVDLASRLGMARGVVQTLLEVAQ